MAARHKIAVFIIIVFAAFAGEAQAAAGSRPEPEVRAYADRYIVSIGDRIRYSIEVRADKNTEIKLPVFTDERIGDFEIKGSGANTKKGFFGGQTVTGWYKITIYKVGKCVIPETEILYRQKGKGEWLSKKTKPANIVVASVLPAGKMPADIKDIKGPLYPREVNWVIVALIAILLIICAIAFMIYRKRTRAGPVKLPHETALEELESLKGLLATTGDVKGYYVGISDCVRRYIERTFKLKAPEMTTEEFLASARESSALSVEQKDLLKEFLSACDLVKFAKYAPARSEMESILSTAKKFVEETKQVNAPLIHAGK